MADGRIEIEAVVLTADEPTMNGRVYPRELIEREIERLRPEMESGRLLGWPADASRTTDSLGEVSHLVRGMKVEDDGKVTAKIEVLSTEKGNLLRELIENREVKFGPRGFGSVVDGVVQDDFKLRTIDVDLDPNGPGMPGVKVKIDGV
jgi:hypothetical protein